MSFSRYIKRLGYYAQPFPPFFKVAFSRKGLLCPEGRQLIWGKLRRLILSAYPPLAFYLRRKYGIKGACASCGASCKLLIQCPHWDEGTHLCKIYEDRPNICKTFPITPSDLADRNLVLKEIPCGFSIHNPTEEKKPDSDQIRPNTEKEEASYSK